MVPQAAFGLGDAAQVGAALGSRLVTHDVHPEPWALFETWYQEAKASPAIRYAHAATLATVDGDGRPDARMVLVHRFGPEGLWFASDFESPKARQLEGQPEAALLFYWGALDRQVRFRGPVILGDDADADACFEERPRASRLSAWSSRQGPGLDSREELEQAWEEVDERFRNVEPVPRPPWWRAWRLAPRTIELWQAGAKRLHDRWLYRRVVEGWRVERLWP